MALRLSFRFARGAHKLLQRSSSLGDCPSGVCDFSNNGTLTKLRKFSDSVLPEIRSSTGNENHLSPIKTSSASIDFKEQNTLNSKSKNLTWSRFVDRRQLTNPEIASVDSLLSRRLKKHVIKEHELKETLVPDRKIGRFTCKEIRSEREIEDAQNLLYKVYVEESGWMFSSENPTGFRLESKNGRMLLKDNLEDQAIWIGVYLNDDIVSCARVIQRDGRGQLDIDRYEDSRREKIQQYLSISNNPNLVEVQRCATHPKCRNIGVNGLALGLAAEIACALGANVIGTTPVDSLRKFLVKCKGRVVDSNFDYGDGIPTTVFYWDWATIPQVFEVIDSLITKRIAGT